MIMLIVVDSIVLFLVAWELIGLFSFLLIGFWSTRSETLSSAIKAVATNRVGDLFLFIFVLVSLNYDITSFSQLVSYNVGRIPLIDKGVLCFSLLIGASGKSAQVGLHGWLLSAMEGPTPVSALMHAATLVTAGALLLIKAQIILTGYLWVAVLIGGLTAFFAGLACVFEKDFKALVAYSTCSQLGFVFVAIGCERYELALLHLANHAIFKATLFFAAGLVIHVYKNQFVGLRKLRLNLPLAVFGIVVSSISLAGLPFSSGFFTKEFIFTASADFNYLFEHLLILLVALGQFFSILYTARIVYILFLADRSVQNVSLVLIGSAGYKIMQSVLFIFA